MTDYKQSTVNGTTWQRAAEVTIRNPADGTPSITYHEHEAMQVGSEIRCMPVTSVTDTMPPGSESDTYALVDSEDWSQPMPQAFRDELCACLQAGTWPKWGTYQILASHYAALAQARDAAAAQG
jgi:hypothetical protein